ncbi:PAS domain S-box protein [Sabulicella glaciei]|uniref:histidine kinase n=1 Tax=Sabulicella glaciei TaxID=2984948 RepID=A0ABT3P036_9PROT|nr:PAS domain S-box protein [Roseococcus sp. MDT2-1-1]MCW8087787.1 PAS domain S-box protein [Roseococcus sp. MDT2-1-1]
MPLRHGTGKDAKGRKGMRVDDHPETRRGAGALAFLAGEGEMARRMAGLDWSASPLGPPEGWPAAIRTTAALMLGSKLPMFIAWGRELGFLYNDACARLLGAKHPAALGARFHDIWAEIRPDIAPLIDAVLAGEARVHEDLPLLVQRSGSGAERAWFTFSFSPLRDEMGAVLGLFCTVSETTQRVLAERRDALLQALGERLDTLAEPEAVRRAAAEALARELGAGRAFFAEPDGEAVRVMGLWSDGSLPEFEARLPLGSLLAGSGAMRDGAATVEGRTSRLAVPLLRDGRHAALLCVDAPPTRAWTAGEARLAEAVAQRGWAASSRAATEAQAQVSEAHLAAIFAQATVGIAEADSTGRFLRMNDRYCGIVGRPREALLALRMQDITHPGDLGDNLPLFDHAARDGASFEIVKRYLRPDGSTVWVHNNVTALREADGRVATILCITVDLTEQRRAEEALRDSEARLRLGLEAGRMVTWEMDLATRDIRRSANAEAVFGPGGRSEDFYNRMPPEDARAVAEAMRAAVEDGAPFEAEFRYHHPDGRMLWLHNQGRILRDPAGRAVRAHGICRDVTARRRAEEALRALNERLEAEVDARTRERNRIFELSNDLFGILGGDGFLSEVNPAWSRLLGFSRAEILSRPLSASVHPDDVPRIAALLDRLRAGQPVEGFEDRMRRADGGYSTIAWTVVMEEGKFYAVGRDVTREREREEALRQLQKMEAIGQLTGGIAHDFNNLLGAVVGGLDLICRRPEDPAQVRRWAEHGLEAAERGARLTAQLLAFSRSQRIESRPLRLARLVEGMRDLLARTLGPAVAIRLALEEGEAFVLSDPTQMEMALLNLAINARDAMPGGGELLIGTRRVAIAQDAELEPGEYVELSVCDTGGGMTAEVAARAFDPFFTTKGVGEGTGLGLSQVYGIARQAGGTARIESVPGKGTTVRLLLPRSEAAPGGSEADAAHAEARPSGAGILVVDDDPEMRGMLAEQLAALGHAVRVAADGPTGLAALEEGVPDLVMLDFAMPGMNGAEVARRIRASRPDLPILFATGFADTAAIEAAAGPGVPVLRKPFRLAELQMALAEALRRG